MCKLYVLVAALCLGFSSMAQTDTTQHKPDTIRMGNFVIVKKNDGHSNNSSSSGISRHTWPKRNISTNWVIVDLGFANFRDNTSYPGAVAAGVIAPALNKEKFDLRNGKSVNVNIWLFMQKLNLISHVVNLKYGVGIELNNYRFDSPVLYDKAADIFTLDQTRTYKKDKLAADYVTVPLMLNFNFTPNHSPGRSFGFSAGVSAGYLYSSRQKIITHEDGKQKIHDDMYLRPFKISYVAELLLGPVKLYGSMATQSMFEKGLDQTPYNIGLRLSNW